MFELQLYALEKFPKLWRGDINKTETMVLCIAKRMFCGDVTPSSRKTRKKSKLSRTYDFSFICCIHVFECHFPWITHTTTADSTHFAVHQVVCIKSVNVTYPNLWQDWHTKKNFFEEQMWEGERKQVIREQDEQHWIFLIELHTHCIATTNDQLAEKGKPNLTRIGIRKNIFVIQQSWMKSSGIGQHY